ncbi:class I SAM-dependent methyltransferase [Pseudonocardia yunnanensis]|uniref:Class I SAM-dependent methyltransferase n=1 Tax=Pseudonocardia yunnanensis TaxID=58107 RepID=A0ABW4EYB9_9PSEU
MTALLNFEQLIAEGNAAPVVGWDFSWLEGRATEERPSWGYLRSMSERMARARAALDVQTGGGEVLAQVPHPPPLLAATESWPPNLGVARENLRPLEAFVVQAADHGTLPFQAQTFDLVVSRHPTTVAWPEIARVLQPGGTYFAQHVGAGSNQELIDFMMGTQPVSQNRSPSRTAGGAEAAGLVVDDLRTQALRCEFHDVGAVVYFLRKVLWTVPGFTAESYHDELARLHDHIQSDGPFVAYSQRVLIEAHKPN